MNKELLKNRLIITSKILLSAIILILLGLILISNRTKSEEVVIPTPLSIVIAVVIVITIIVYAIMLGWEIKLSFKESGSYIFATMVAQFVFLFGALYLLETFLVEENESIQSMLGFAAALTLSNKSIDFWKRYDKK